MHRALHIAPQNVIVRCSIAQPRDEVKNLQVISRVGRLCDASTPLAGTLEHRSAVTRDSAKRREHPNQSRLARLLRLRLERRRRRAADERVTRGASIGWKC